MTKAQKEQDIIQLEKFIEMDKAICKNFPDNEKFKAGLKEKEQKLEELKNAPTED